MARDCEATDEAGAEEQWERQTAARLESARHAAEATERLQRRRAREQQPSKSNPRD